MRKTMVFAAFAALVSLASCQKEELVDKGADNNVSPVFTASISGATKTAVDVNDGKVAWETTDEITVTDASSASAVYTIESIDTETGKATFVIKDGQTALGAGPYTAVYGTEPATAQTWSETAGKLYMTAPETSGNSFTFAVQCGLMKLKLTKAGESIKKISVTGKPENGSESTYTLTCTEAQSIDAAKDFFIALPAGCYTKIEIVNAQYVPCTLNAASGVAIAANHIKPVTFGEKKLKFAVPVPEIVELGLSVKWASFNLGASKPEDTGGYYQWGGTQDVSDKSIRLDGNNCPHHTGWELDKGWTKYIPSDKSSYGTADNKTVLEPEDDAARILLGSDWRTPTPDEWQELTSKCTWTWTTIGGIDGYKVQSNVDGFQKNWIFLPAAGNRSDDRLNGVGITGLYWSSSIKPDQPNCSFCAWFQSDFIINNSDGGRANGYSVRPVTLSHKHDLWTVLGKPARDWDSGYKEAYRCKLCEKYYEDEDGKVLIGSESDYEAWKSKGGRGFLKPLCDDVVDLGLSVKWAAFNLGASRPWEYGGYYQWAGTEDVTDQSIDLKWTNCPYHTQTDDTSLAGWTKYVSDSDPSLWSGPGNADRKSVLEPEDDAAHVKLGGKWRMPTKEEFVELYENCTWEVKTMNEIKGKLFTSKINGNSIFLPAAGYRDGKELRLVGSDAHYWSSTRAVGGQDGHRSCLAFRVKFYTHRDYDQYIEDDYRYRGRSVRPVQEK